MDYVQPPSPPPDTTSMAPRTMGNHYAMSMRELSNKCEDMTELSFKDGRQQEAFQLAEDRLRHAEVRLAGVSQQRDLAISLAKEVGTGQAAVYQQSEIERNEQAAQTCRTNTIIADARAQVEYLGMMLQETRSQNVECTQLLSGSISSVYAPAGEVSSTKQLTLIRDAEVARVSSNNEELKMCWEQAVAANSSLRDRLSMAEALSQSRASPDPEIIMRLDDEPLFHAELSSSLARESQWNEEAKKSKAEFHYLANETLIMKRVSNEELSAMKDECRRSSAELSELAALLSASQSKNMLDGRARIRQEGRVPPYCAPRPSEIIFQ